MDFQNGLARLRTLVTCFVIVAPGRVPGIVSLLEDTDLEAACCGAGEKFIISLSEMINPMRSGKTKNGIYPPIAHQNRESHR